MSIFSLLGLDNKAQDLKQAIKLFKEAKFDYAEKAFSEILKSDSANLSALFYKSYLSLLKNRLDESEQYLKAAQKLQPTTPAFNEFFSEIYYRRKDFTKAALFFRMLKREAMALKMESFRDVIAYETSPNFNEVKIQFLITDPLPVVKVTINEKFEGNFFIDTGGGEIILNESFAKKINLETLLKENVSGFAAGKSAPIGHGKIASITLNDLTVKNIPVITLDLHQLEFKGIKLDGAIGTVFLYQFLSTIDYKNNQLILRNKQKTDFNNVIKECKSPKISPFVIAGDHFMMAKGSINQCDSMLFFIDTGLADNAFTCPKSLLKKANLTIQKNKKIKDSGGGKGEFYSYPFAIDKLSLGETSQSNLNGLFGPFPENIQNAFGFQVDGLISHQFFKNKVLTFDFKEMKYIISE